MRNARVRRLAAAALITGLDSGSKGRRFESPHSRESLKLTFVADKPSPRLLAYQEFLMAADASAEYFS